MSAATSGSAASAFMFALEPFSLDHGILWVFCGQYLLDNDINEIMLNFTTTLTASLVTVKSSLKKPFVVLNWTDKLSKFGVYNMCPRISWQKAKKKLQNGVRNILLSLKHMYVFTQHTNFLNPCIQE